MKKYISKEKKEVWIGEQSNTPIQRIDSKIEINPSVLTQKEINEKFDLYQYEEETLEEGEYFTSQMVFDKKTGVCKPKKEKYSKAEIERMNKEKEIENTVDGIPKEIIEKLTLQMLKDHGYIE